MPHHHSKADAPAALRRRLAGQVHAVAAYKHGIRSSRPDRPQKSHTDLFRKRLPRKLYYVKLKIC